MTEVFIHWPHGASCRVPSGIGWLEAADQANYAIPTGCLGGSCGACEIDVDGETVRACISTVPAIGPDAASNELRVEVVSDPFW